MNLSSLVRFWRWNMLFSGQNCELWVGLWNRKFRWKASDISERLIRRDIRYIISISLHFYWIISISHFIYCDSAYIFNVYYNLSSISPLLLYSFHLCFLLFNFFNVFPLILQFLQASHYYYYYLSKLSFSIVLLFAFPCFLSQPL